MTLFNTAKLIAITPLAEELIAHCARVSSPNQMNEKYVGLLKYCIKHKHWSVFETASMTVEIVTTRSVSPQLIRHRSFTFQEFSQRYADPSQVSDNPLPTIQDYIEEKSFRAQDTKNRQNSIEMTDLNALERCEKLRDRMISLAMISETLYDDMLAEGVAKEVARDCLLACTPTRLYMTGNIRNWIHYLEVRTADGVQLEHKQIAEAVKEIFQENLPNIYKAVFND